MNRAPYSQKAGGVASLMLGLCIVNLAMGQADQPTLDDLLDLSPSKPAVIDQSPDPSNTMEPDEDFTESVERALSASDAADVFEQAIDEMDFVSRRLGRTLDPGVETQRMQESILRKLDQVIKSAKNQSSGGGGGSGEPRDQDQGSSKLEPQQQSPGNGQDPSLASGQQASSGAAGSGTPDKPEGQDTPIEQLRKEWGVLPPRVREELSDGLRERFSPLYRRMTEAYYKALAEQE
jgi:hypothetical protein